MPLPLPETLTPSKLSRFVQCPLAFRYSYIDRLPEPPTVPQFLGTLVHRAMELFFTDSSGEERTTSAATVAMDQAWSEIEPSDDLAMLCPDDKSRSQLMAHASTLIDRYFELENPSGIETVGIELDLRAPFEGVEMRGIIDRLDRLPDGQLAIVDYKTGRAPRQEFARSAMVGVHFYAFLCEQIYGQRPREVRLMYLKDRVVVVESPTDQTMRGLRQRALAVWAAIERACESGDFRPSPSRLCKTCSHRAICPAMKGAEGDIELTSVG